MSTLTEQTYKLRLAGERLAQMNQAELFAAWAAGEVTAESELWSPAGERWKPLGQLVPGAQAEATARGRVYHVALEGRRHGPYTLAEAASRYRRRLDAAYWCEGMAEWAPTNTLPDLEEPSAEREPTPGVSRTGVPLVKPQRSRGVFILLALLFGISGIHDFYAGHLQRGLNYILAQLGAGVVWVAVGGEIGPKLALTIVALCYIYVLLELCTETQDGEGDPLA